MQFHIYIYLVVCLLQHGVRLGFSLFWNYCLRGDYGPSLDVLPGKERNVFALAVVTLLGYQIMIPDRRREACRQN